MVQLSGSELQTYEALYKNMGARIMFSCDKVTYKGIIDMIFPDAYQVKLRHTVIIQGNHYMGNLRFKFHEVSSFSVVESSESVNRYPRNDYLLNILKNDRPYPNKTIARALYGDNLSDDSDDEITEEEKNEEQFVLELPSHLEDRLPKNFIQIDSINEDFYEAIYAISRQQDIGVSFHGPLISRFGTLTWVCISTNVFSFLFDVQQLGKDAFEKGLKDIFESKSIKKIIHDSRFPSDCLAHQYGTLLTNVFDTRVADFVISMQRYNEKYKFHSYTSLDCLLRTYLNVPQEFIFQRETSQSTSNQTASSSKRPISNDYLYDLLKSVLYLKLLQEKLSKELLVPLHRATGFYRTVLSRASTKLIDFLGTDLSRPDQVPPCIIMNGIQTVHFQKPVKVENIALKCAFINPKSGELITSSLGSPDAVRASLLRKLNRKKEAKSLFLNKSTMNESSVTSKEKMYPQSSNRTSQASNNPSANVNGGMKTFSLSTKPSLRHLDEVYHKLVNQKGANQSENLVGVKPSVDCVSTFVDKQSIARCSKNNFVSSVKVSRETSCFNLIDSCGSGSHSNKTESDETEDVWARLRAEIAAEKAEFPSVDYCERKIHFMPG